MSDLVKTKLCIGESVSSFFYIGGYCGRRVGVFLPPRREARRDEMKTAQRKLRRRAGTDFSVRGHQPEICPPGGAIKTTQHTQIYSRNSWLCR